MAEQKQAKENVTVIDATDLVVGRMGSVLAKRLLLGESITLINCKDAVVLGRKKFLVERYKNKLANKVVKQGPYYSRSPSDIVKRSFRNMLPYKNERGVQAFKRLKCYNSTPSILLNVKKERIEQAEFDKESVFYYTKVGDLCKVLGYTKVN